MILRSCLVASALLWLVTASHAGPAEVADLVKQVQAKKGKVVLDGKGMPVEVHLHDRGFTDKDLAILKPYPGLRVLNLQHTRVTDAGIEQVAQQHPALEVINIHDTPVTPACVKHLAKLKSLHTIQIYLSNVTDELVRELRAHNLLHVWAQVGTWSGKRPRSPAEAQRIMFDGARVTPACLKEFADFTGVNYVEYKPIDDTTLKTLAEIKLLHAFWLADEGATWDRRPKSPADVARFSLRWPNSITPNGFKELTAFTGLKYLELSAFHATPEVLKIISSMKSLEMISFGEHVGDAGLDELAGLPNLHTLSFHPGAGVTDEGLKSLARIKSLRTLRVTGPRITAAGLKHLGDLPLTRLDIDPALIDDAMLKSLHERKKLHTLGIANGKAGKLDSQDDIVYLILEKTSITDASVKLLAGMPNLKGIRLTGSRITDNGVAELKAARPKLSVRR